MEGEDERGGGRRRGTCRKGGGEEEKEEEGRRRGERKKKKRKEEEEEEEEEEKKKEKNPLPSPTSDLKTGSLVGYPTRCMTLQESVLGLVRPLSIYCDWVKQQISAQASTSVSKYIKIVYAYPSQIYTICLFLRSSGDNSTGWLGVKL